ncbi:MAG: ribosomal RNA small subunit methyltransferase A [Synergistaceae bacterium]|nr:ribosomal RNA small subunit methyltransferase A [Synergistaceae bacterium]
MTRPPEAFLPLHRLGQNFLVDRNVLAEIVERADVGPGDVVLEVGPGHGVLTRALLDRGAAHVHAVEMDPRLRPELDPLAEADDRLSLHWGDALAVDLASLSPFPTKAVANIPYNITTPLIWKLLGHARLGLRYHLYMVQKEAADRLTAPADTRARYPLGVTIEAMGRAVRVRRVPPSCFRPRPRVESALLEIQIDRGWELMEDALWSELLHRGFAHRRKTLLNGLKGFKGIQGWDAILAEAGAGPGDRAEDLSTEAWLAVWRLARERLAG